MTGKEYYLQDEKEIASGFRLNADTSFDFFFSSGGIDRTGKGVWTIKKDTLTLNTPEKPLKNFRLITSKQIPEDSITIKVTAKNKMILGYVHYGIKTANDTIQGITNEEGVAIIKKVPLHSISLSHQLWPDKEPSVFEMDNKENNYFEFGIEKWISDLIFNNLTLIIKGDVITGGHPMMPGGKFTYRQNQ